MADLQEFAAFKRRAQRERTARRAAEQLLEVKAAELYELNASLEAQVAGRTQELVAALDAAIAASQARNEFFARMSHEIRTPMNAVIGMTDYMLLEDPPPSIFEGLTTVRSASHSLLGIINDILDFSKIEAGGLSLQAVEFDLEEQLTSVADLLRINAQTQGLALTLSLDRLLARRVVGAAPQLRQVLLNLVGNAVKFTEKGGVELGARLLEDRGDTLLVECWVSDTGPGISADDCARIFRAFEQADGSNTRAHGGTGLGLAICERLVEALGGKIGVESELGIGTCFRFTTTLGAAASSCPRPLPDWDIMVLGAEPDTKTLVAQALEGPGDCMWTVRDSEVDAIRAMLERASEDDPFDVVLIRAEEETSASNLVAALNAMPLLRGVDVAVVGPSAETVKGDEWSPKVVDTATFDARHVRAALASLDDREDDVSSPVPEVSAERPARILVVDDNPTNVLVASRLLERVGHHVESASNGLAAVDLVASHTYDLVLMDVQMPGISGIEATRRIRNAEYGDAHTVPIIGFSAGTRPEECERCLQGGMNGYLTKPVSAEELYATVDALRRHDPPNLAASPSDPAEPDSQVRGAEALSRLHLRIASPEATAMLGGEPEIILACMEAFVGSAPDVESALTEAIESKDSQGFKQVAHTLKGSVASVLGPEMRETAIDLEAAAANPNGNETVRLGEQLLGHLRATVDVFQAYQQEQTG